MSNAKAVREPLFHISKRSNISFGKRLLTRTLSLVAAFVVTMILSAIFLKASPIQVIQSFFSGSFGTVNRFWRLLHGVAILLCISVAIAPAFRMRFWNIGADGQTLIGCLACSACIWYLGGSGISNAVLLIICLIASVAAAIVWAIIPALFKALFNTNETLFTLMMNYIATQLVLFFINLWDKSGHGMIRRFETGIMPTIGNEYLLNIIIVTVITVLMFIYMRYSKHGYEIAVVGESENTAKYIGISVKKVIIRTMVLSGAICGIAGFLLVSSYNHVLTDSLVDGRGFTAIIVAWLAKFNPLYMVLSSLLVVFLQNGTAQLLTNMSIANGAFAEIVTGIVFFFVIGCNFFIDYKLMFRSDVAAFFGKIKQFFQKIFAPVGRFFKKIAAFFVGLWQKMFPKKSSSGTSDESTSNKEGQ